MMLVRTPFHAPTESLFGYALRLSETNGYETPSHILRLAGFAQPTTPNTAFSIEKLATILGRDPKQLRNIAYTDSSDGQSHFQILGHHLGIGLGAGPLRLKRPAICPECVSSLGYIEAFYDLKLAVACPHHGRALLSQCTRCGNQLSNCRPGLLICRCGASLAEQVQPTVSERIIGLMTALKSILERTDFPSTKSDIGLPIGHLKNTPLRWILASLPRFGRFNRPNFPAYSLEVADGIAEVLENWPYGFHRFLEQHGRSKEAPTFHKRFAIFFDKIFGQAEIKVNLNWMYSELIQFGLTKSTDSIVDRRMIPGRLQDRRIIPLKELSRRTGYSEITLQKFSRNGVLNIRSMGSGSKRRYFIDTETLNLIPRSNREKHLGKRKAAAFLGVTVRVLERLRDLGEFSFSHDLPPRKGFSQADLMKFRERMIAASPSISQSPCPDKVISLSYLMRFPLLPGVERKAELIVDFLNGSLPSVGRTGETADQIFFDRKIISARALASRTVIVKGALTYRETTTMIGCSETIVSGLIKSKRIKKVSIGELIRIDRYSVEQFNKTYAPLAKYSKEWETRSEHLKILCDREKISLIAIPYSRNQFHSYFISHPDVKILHNAFISNRRNMERTKSLANAARSARESRPDPVIQLRRYLKNLLANDHPLPWHDGTVNRAAIARACGLARDVFTRNETANTILLNFVHKERLRRLASGELADPPLICLRNYLDRLKKSGELLPMWGGKPNKKAISENAGFSRGFLLYNDEAKRLLEAFVRKQKSR